MSFELVRQRFEEAITVKRALLDDEHVGFAVAAAELLADTFRRGGRVLVCGNGGSAADGMHLAGELVGRFKLDRDALSAINLADSQAVLTCVGNDDSFDEIFARGVAAHGREGDVLLAISTSGTSANVLRAVEVARERGLRVVGMTGAKGDALAAASDLCLRVPSEDTARIQEGYLLVGHVVCELVERQLFA